MSSPMVVEDPEGLDGTGSADEMVDDSGEVDISALAYEPDEFEDEEEEPESEETEEGEVDDIEDDEEEPESEEAEIEEEDEETPEDPYDKRLRDLEAERQRIEQERQNAMLTDQQRQQQEYYKQVLEQSDKEFLQAFKVEHATKGDDGALLVIKRYIDHAFSQLPDIAKNYVHQELNQIQNYAAGRKAMLDDPAIEHLHPYVNDIIDLVTRGYSEQEALSMVDRMVRGQQQPNQKQPKGKRPLSVVKKRKTAMAKSRQRAHLEASGAGKTGTKQSKSRSKRQSEDEQLGKIWEGLLEL